MSTVTVVGSIAFDAVETEAGVRERLLGGSATHFSLAASFFADTRVVGPVGEDFGEAEFAVLRDRGVNTDDIEVVEGGKTFFWSGRYERDVNVRHTLRTDLNVFEHFEPKLSPESAGADVLFLANIVPALQIAVREQCTSARFTALDSMNLWIDVAREDLVRAARAVLNMPPPAPRVVVAKQGEYGASLFSAGGEEVFALPAFPTPDVVDPTGAGDTFAGGFVGYVAAHGDEDLRTALAYGTALASFNVEAFGTERLQTLTGDEVAERVGALERMTRLDASEVALRG